VRQPTTLSCRSIAHIPAKSKSSVYIIGLKPFEPEEPTMTFGRKSCLAIAASWAAIFVFAAANLPAQEINVEKDKRFNAVAWMQNAAEYQALTRQAYRLAEYQLEKSLQDKSWTADEVQLLSVGFSDLPPAVILDVDETVLDDSPYNARNITNGTPYDLPSWNRWCLEEKATPIPGALKFVKAAQKMEVKIFFVTNRRDLVKKATINNLKKYGFPARESNVLTRNDDAGRQGDKLSRRAMVAKDHRIVLLIGDNLSDICSEMDNRDQKTRNAIAELKNKALGTRWIVLPNPVYGGWERALANGKKSLRLAQDVSKVKPENVRPNLSGKPNSSATGKSEKQKRDLVYSLRPGCIR
jgi:acid phosphatase